MTVDQITRVPINPRLPRNFDSTPNDARPKSHQAWWYRPYIVTQEAWGTPEQRAAFTEHWPSGVRYDVRCLDGGAWDRSTCWGNFATLEQALACANGGPIWGTR